MAIGWLVFIDGTDFLDNLVRNRQCKTGQHVGVLCFLSREQSGLTLMINTILGNELGKGPVYGNEDFPGG